MTTKFSIYITIGSIKEFINDLDKLNRFMSLIKDLGIEKTYLENYRDGVLLNKNIVYKMRDMFEKEFKVGGGVAIGTWGSGMGDNADWWKVLACISDEKNIYIFEKAVVELAEVFSEILIDDFWANWCYSRRDIENFNDLFGLDIDVSMFNKLIWTDREIQRLWAQYSLNLLTEVSKRIINKSKDVNKNIRIWLKFAEWRESYLHRGLCLGTMANIFDGIYIGTESREGTFRYGSVFVVDYARAIVGNKLRGVWFDSYNGLALPSQDSQADVSSWMFPSSAPEVFVEQFWHSFLAYVDEIVFFQGTDYLSNNRRKHIELLKESSTQLKLIEDFIDSSRMGLVIPALQTAYRSPYSSYIEDILGSIAIPITSKKIENISKGDIVLIKDNMLNYLNLWNLVKRGINIIITSASAEKISKGDIGIDGLELIGVEDRYNPILATTIDVIGFTDSRYTYIREHRRPYVFPVGPILRVRDDVKTHLLALGVDNNIYPVIYEVDHDSASVFVLSIDRYAFNLVHGFHEIVRQKLRDIIYRFTGIKLDYRVIGGENQELSNISIIVYNNKKSIGIINNNIYDSFFSLIIDRNISRIKSIEKAILGNIEIRLVEDHDNIFRVHIDITRHSLDVVKYRS